MKAVVTALLVSVAWSGEAQPGEGRRCDVQAMDEMLTPGHLFGAGLFRDRWLADQLAGSRLLGTHMLGDQFLGKQLLGSRLPELLAGQELLRDRLWGNKVWDNRLQRDSTRDLAQPLGHLPGLLDAPRHFQHRVSRRRIPALGIKKHWPMRRNNVSQDKATRPQISPGLKHRRPGLGPRQAGVADLLSHTMRPETPKTVDKVPTRSETRAPATRDDRNSENTQTMPSAKMATTQNTVFEATDDDELDIYAVEDHLDHANEKLPDAATGYVDNRGQFHYY